MSLCLDLEGCWYSWVVCKRFIIINMHEQNNEHGQHEQASNPGVSSTFGVIPNCGCNKTKSGGRRPGLWMKQNPLIKSNPPGF